MFGYCLAQFNFNRAVVGLRLSLLAGAFFVLAGISPLYAQDVDDGKIAQELSDEAMPELDVVDEGEPDVNVGLDAADGESEAVLNEASADDFSDVEADNAIGDGVSDDSLVELPVSEDGLEQEMSASTTPDVEFDEDLFFDSGDPETVVPKGAVDNSAISNVNPRETPASKFIVVKKVHDKDDKRPQLLVAERAMKLGRYGAALELYNNLYSKDKRDIDVLMGRAVAYQRLERDDFAIMAYEELLDFYPDSVSAQVNLLGLISERYPAVAVRKLLELREGNESNVGIVAQLAVASANMKSYNDAIRYLGIASSIQPHNAIYLYNMGVIADQAGAREDAINYYEQALELDTLYSVGGLQRDTVFERLSDLR